MIGTKIIALITIVLLIVGIVGISGCTNSVSQNSSNISRTVYGNFSERSMVAGEWQVHITKNSSFLETATIDKVIEKLKSSPEGHIITNNGIKTINGISVYHNTYQKANKVGGNLYFEKYGRWYWIQWNDQQGSLNKKAIDNEIAYYINKM